MKILLFGDFHGKIKKINNEDFDIIISAGDFFGLSEKAYKLALKLRKLKFMVSKFKDAKFKNPDQERKYLKEYKYFEKKYLQILKKEERQNFANARKILEYLDSFGKPVFTLPGNWESPPPFIDHSLVYRQSMRKYKFLINGFSNITELHMKEKLFGGFSFIGLGLTQMPENIYYENPRIAKIFYEGSSHLRLYNHWIKKMNILFKKAMNRKNEIVFISHNQPYNTALDLISDKRSPAYGEHYGSCVVRKLIEDYQPLIFLGAHMHESKGKCLIGKTVCVNPGFGGDGEYAIIELGKRSVNKISLKKTKE